MTDNSKYYNTHYVAFLSIKANSAGSEALKMVVFKSCTFSDITQCSLLKENHCCGGKCGLHHQGSKVQKERHQPDAGSNYTALYPRDVK
jgi:hypothetical protein